MTLPLRKQAGGQVSTKRDAGGWLALSYGPPARVTHVGEGGMMLRRACCLSFMGFMLAGCSSPEVSAAPRGQTAQLNRRALLSPIFASARRPRNGLIALSAPAAGGEHIFSIDAEGGSRLQLTNEGSGNKFPAWSADGTTIVFSSNRTGTVELWTMRADGGEQTQIPTELPGHKAVPQLSPDGTTIVFAYIDPVIGHPEVWTISADGASARKLTTTPKAATGPTWSVLPHFSPEGRRIVYASTKSGSSQVWIMNADGSDQTQVTSGFGVEFPDANAPKWSPDGSQIAFWSGFETEYGEIWTMRADGTGARQLTDQPGTISSDNPAWSPDGTKILFDTNRQTSPQIWMMNADGSDQHLLVDIGIGDTQFSWQPLPSLTAPGRRRAVRSGGGAASLGPSRPVRVRPVAGRDVKKKTDAVDDHAHRADEDQRRHGEKDRRPAYAATLTTGRSIRSHQRALARASRNGEINGQNVSVAARDD